MNAEARALAQALQRSLQAEDSTTLVAELWPPYELHAAGRLRSWRSHAQRWRDHVRPAFGPKLAGAVGPADVDAYRAARLAAGAALATVNREIALLRRLLRFSARRGTIGETRLHGHGMTAELIADERNVRRTIVEDSPTARIALPDLLAAAGPRLRAFVLLVHRSGMRRTEASLLEHDRIDRRLGVAWIPDGDTKGGEGGRYVPLPPEVLTAIAELPRTPGVQWVFPSRRKAVRTSDPTFRGPEHPDTWTHRFGRLVRKLGLEGPDGPPWLHDLRRSFVTLSRRRGEDTTAIMAITGHVTDVAFTRYNVFSLVDVLATKARLEAARADELRAVRRPPKRVPATRPHQRTGTA